MKRFVCSVCGFVCEEDSMPAECPICRQTDSFEEDEEESGEETR